MKNLFPVLILVILAACFLPSLISDTVQWDDTVLARAIEIGKPHIVGELYSQAGWQLHAHFLAGLASLPQYLNWARFLSFGLIYLSVLCIFQCLSYVPGLSRAERTFIALLCAVYPLDTYRLGLATLEYEFSFLLFYLAYVILIRIHFQEERKTPKEVWVAFFLLMGAFFYPALLPYHHVILAGLFFLTYRPDQKYGFQIISFLKKYGAFLLMPALHFFAKSLFLPTSGIYAADQYNELIFDIRKVSANIVESFAASLEIPASFFYDFAALAKHDKITLLSIGIYTILAVGIPLALIFFHKTEVKSGDAHAGREKMAGLILFAAALWMAAIIPYALVNKVIRPGFDTRHGILTALPIGLMIIGLSRRFFHNFYGRFLYSVLILFFCMNHIYQQVLWRNRFVKNQNIVALLKQDYPDLASRGIIVSDKTELGMKESARFYEWGYLVRKNGMDPSLLVINEGDQTIYQHLPEFFQKFGPYHDRYMIPAEAPKAGDWMRLTVVDAGHLSEVEIYQNYYLSDGRGRDVMLAPYLKVTVSAADVIK